MYYIFAGLFLFCLVGLFVTLRGSRRPVARPSSPYSAKLGLLSSAERHFYRALQAAFPGHLLFAQVRLADILDHNGDRQAFYKIASKSADFVICDVQFSIIAVIELDDKTHQRPDRIDRDTFVNRAFTDAGVPIVRFPVTRDFFPDDIRKAVLSTVN